MYKQDCKGVEIKGNVAEYLQNEFVPANFDKDKVMELAENQL